MKRMSLPEISDALFVAEFSSVDVPEDIAAYIAELKLLYYVPFAYLVAEEAFLPPESVRFFYIDNSWTEALADGSLSIGRNDSTAARVDGCSFGPALNGAKKAMGRIRDTRVHQNHRARGTLENLDFSQQNGFRTGFIIRSALTRKWKGLGVVGYNGENKPLSILRSEQIAAGILICVFDGELAKVTVTEPHAGLRFGAFENNREINVKSLEEGEGFGKFLPGKKVELKSDENGRLNVLTVRDGLEKALEKSVTPASFAFELMLAAQKAVFLQKGAGK